MINKHIVLGILIGILLTMGVLILTAEGSDDYPPEGHKMWICHVPPGNPDNARTLLVDENSWKAGHTPHNSHSLDYVGTCPDPTTIPSPSPTVVEPTSTYVPTNTPVVTKISPTNSPVPSPTQPNTPTPSSTPTTPPRRPTNTPTHTQTAQPSSTPTNTPVVPTNTPTTPCEVVEVEPECTVCPHTHQSISPANYETEINTLRGSTSELAAKIVVLEQRINNQILIFLLFFLMIIILLLLQLLHRGEHLLNDNKE